MSDPEGGEPRASIGRTVAIAAALALVAAIFAVVAYLGHHVAPGP
ncbi:MAG TPA: hypothetical protein VHF22_05175 [Planctomycetota bacterium]|nr:hypothetical protein [Planctomycetota bacterium]